MQGELQSARQQVHKLQAAAEAAKLINDQQTADIQVLHHQLSCSRHCSCQALPDEILLNFCNWTGHPGLVQVRQTVCAKSGAKHLRTATLVMGGWYHSTQLQGQMLLCCSHRAFAEHALTLPDAHTGLCWACPDLP